MAKTNRIEEIPPDQMTPEQTKVFEKVAEARGRLPTPYKIWIHSAEVAAVMEKLGSFLNNESSLSTREVELVVCMCANRWEAKYVWESHVKHALKAGWGIEVFDAISKGEQPHLENARERAVYDLAKTAMEARDEGPQEVFDRSVELLGRNGIAEVLTTIGYFTSVAIGMKLHFGSSKK